MQNPDYESTYSAIHGRQLNKPRDSYSGRDSYEGAYSPRASYDNSYSPGANYNAAYSPRSSHDGSFSPRHNVQNAQNIRKFPADRRRTDVVSVQYLSAASPSSSKVKSKNSRLSEPGPGQPAGSNFISEAVEYIPSSDPDQMRDWFGACKRFQGVKRALRPPPYHVDPLGGPAKTRSSSVPPSRKVVAVHKPKVLRDSLRDSMMDLLQDDSTVSSYPHYSATSVTGVSERQNNQKDQNNRNISFNDSKDGGRSPRSPRAMDPGSEFQSLSITIPSQSNNNDNIEGEMEGRNKSLYSSIMDLADDNSYQAHYDRMNISISPTYGMKSSAISPQRMYKLAPRNTNSLSMLSLLRSDDDVNVSSQGSRSKVHGNKNNDVTDKEKKELEKERVKGVEINILNHLQGRVGGLRHHLNQMDLSHSGVVNFPEFRAALKQLGVEATNPQLREVFQGSSEDRKGKGVVNNFETWGQDVRYSKGSALNIEKFTEKLAGKAIESEAKKGKSDCYITEQTRAIKKVLHATNKRDDPMKVFCHLAQGNGYTEGKGAIVGHLAPQQLKEGLQTLGSNLTDKEFEYLLEKVGTSYDGKISLSEFDEILHTEVGGYDSDYSTVKRGSLDVNPRYTKTYQSCTTIQQHTQPEYDKVTDSKIARGDRMKWGKLQGVIQENCQNLPEAFKNAAVQIRNSRSGSRDLPQNKSHRRSHSLGSTRSWARFADGGEAASEVTSSGRCYGREREEREDNVAAVNDLPLLPVKNLRDILSNAGVQLGTDDAERLTSLITREVSNRTDASSIVGSTEEPSVSFDRFCEIVGIAKVLNPSTSQKGKPHHVHYSNSVSYAHSAYN